MDGGRHADVPYEDGECFMTNITYRTVVEVFHDLNFFNRRALVFFIVVCVILTGLIIYNLRRKR